MRHVHPLQFDDLEAKQLLSKASIAVPHTKPAVTAAPIVLNGTLTVDNNAATTTENADSSTTTVTPVTGRVATLGKVHGVWSETTDPYGDIEGLDAEAAQRDGGCRRRLQQRLAWTGTQGWPQHTSLPWRQAAWKPSGGYSGSTETGSIELFPNSRKIRSRQPGAAYEGKLTDVGLAIGASACGSTLDPDVRVSLLKGSYRVAADFRAPDIQLPQCTAIGQRGQSAVGDLGSRENQGSQLRQAGEMSQSDVSDLGVAQFQAASRTSARRGRPSLRPPRWSAVARAK